MFWVTGFIDEVGQREALDWATAIHAEFQSQLPGYTATSWKVIKHPDRDEWALPWDKDRVELVEIPANLRVYVRKAYLRGDIKKYKTMLEDGWFPENE